MEQADLARLAEKLNSARHKLLIAAGQSKEFLEDWQNRAFDEVEADIRAVEDEIFLTSVRMGKAPQSV